MRKSAKTDAGKIPNMEQEIGSWDSVLLENLSEESFINNLHQRYKRDLIYVSKPQSAYPRKKARESI